MSYVYFIKVNGLTKATIYRSDYQSDTKMKEVTFLST